MGADVELGFPEASLAEAGRLAADLESFLDENFPKTEASVRRDNDDAQDMGASIALVLGTPSVILLAKGIGDWLKRRGGPALILRNNKKGIEIIVDKDMSDHAKRDIILEALKL